MDCSDTVTLQKGNLLIRNMKVLRHFLKDIESNKFKLNAETLQWSSENEYNNEGYQDQ